jgi:hypothetical protein
MINADKTRANTGLFQIGLDGRPLAEAATELDPDFETGCQF